LAKHDSLAASEDNDATEEARGDEIGRSVPSALDQIINLKHELAQLAARIDWDFIDGEIARSTATRAGLGSRHGSRSGCYCSSIFMDYRTKACASVGSTTHTSSSSPGKSFSNTNSRMSART
jgi:hypothetical protein